MHDTKTGLEQGMSMTQHQPFVSHFREETEAKAVARRAGEEEAAGVTVKLARAVRLAGASQSADAGECHKKPGIE
jgi:hypothetical protein